VPLAPRRVTFLMDMFGGFGWLVGVSGL
jgi:hypothetical protein